MPSILFYIFLKAHIGFWGDGGLSCDQGGDERSEEGFSASAGVVDELEEAQIDRQFLLRDPPVGMQPGAEQRPEALHGIEVDFAEPIAIVVAGILRICSQTGRADLC